MPATANFKACRNRVPHTEHEVYTRGAPTRSRCPRTHAGNTSRAMFGGWDAGYFQKQSDQTMNSRCSHDRNHVCGRELRKASGFARFLNISRVQIFGNTPAPLEREGVSPTNRIAPNKSGAAIKNLSVNKLRCLTRSYFRTSNNSA